jgi:hypothetical protein
MEGQVLSLGGCQESIEAGAQYHYDSDDDMNSHGSGDEAGGTGHFSSLDVLQCQHMAAPPAANAVTLDMQHGGSATGNDGGGGGIEQQELTEAAAVVEPLEERNVGKALVERCEGAAGDIELEKDRHEMARLFIATFAFSRSGSGNNVSFNCIFGIGSMVELLNFLDFGVRNIANGHYSPENPKKFKKQRKDKDPSVLEKAFSKFISETACRRLVVAEALLALDLMVSGSDTAFRVLLGLIERGDQLSTEQHDARWGDFMERMKCLQGHLLDSSATHPKPLKPGQKLIAVVSSMYWQKFAVPTLVTLDPSARLLELVNINVPRHVQDNIYRHAGRMFNAIAKESAALAEERSRAEFERRDQEDAERIITGMDVPAQEDPTALARYNDPSLSEFAAAVVSMESSKMSNMLVTAIDNHAMERFERVAPPGYVGQIRGLAARGLMEDQGLPEVQELVFRLLIEKRDAALEGRKAKPMGNLAGVVAVSTSKQFTEALEQADEKIFPQEPMNDQNDEDDSKGGSSDEEGNNYDTRRQV